MIIGLFSIMSSFGCFSLHRTEARDRYLLKDQWEIDEDHCFIRFSPQQVASSRIKKKKIQSQPTDIDLMMMTSISSFPSSIISAFVHESLSITIVVMMIYKFIYIKNLEQTLWISMVSITIYSLSLSKNLSTRAPASPWECGCTGSWLRKATWSWLGMRMCVYLHAKEAGTSTLMCEVPILKMLDVDECVAWSSSVECSPI